MKTSVIICTYNRCHSLKETLQALKRQTGHSEDLEILVVDNNSSDATRGVVSREAEELPSIRYIFEGRQGKSYALNKGIEEAKGDLLLFTDDDILPDTDWIAKIEYAFSEHQADCVGGKVLPLWLGKKPWYFEHPRLHRNFCAIWALLDHGDAILTADGKDENFLYGCNIAFRKKVFGELGLFRTDLGRVKKNLLCGEDTEMMGRILTAGKKVMYFPDIVVRHKVGADRLKLSYARRRRFDGALSNYERLRNGQSTKIPLWFIRECLTNGFSAVGAYLSGKRDAGVERDLLFWAQSGQIVGGMSQKWKKSRA